MIRNSGRRVRTLLTSSVATVVAAATVGAAAPPSSTRVAAAAPSSARVEVGRADRAHPTSKVRIDRLGRPYVTRAVVLTSALLGSVEPAAAPADPRTHSGPKEVIEATKKQTVGPSTLTGWGRMHFDSFTRLDHNRWRAVIRYTYENPAVAIGSMRIRPGDATDGCLFGISFGSCWNKPWTWHWGSIFDTVGDVGHDWWNHIDYCVHYVKHYRYLGTLQTALFGRAIGYADVGRAGAVMFRSNLAGLAITSVLGCTWSYQQTHPGLP